MQSAGPPDRRLEVQILSPAPPRRLSATVAGRRQLALLLLHAARQGIALGGHRLQLLVPLGLPRVQIRFARVDVLQLPLETRDALLGGNVEHEEGVAQESSEHEARDDEQPGQPELRGIGHDVGNFSQLCYDALVELQRFFEGALKASFRDLALHDDAVVAYLADLLTRFARTEQLFPRGITGQRLERVVDLLLEAQALWRDPSFRPEGEVTVRRHIGDYTLFMLGVFRERVEQNASTGYYVTQGQRAYRYVSEHDRASTRPVRPAGGPLFGRLADRFEGYARALDYARRVHFRAEPSLPFFA
jgi:hypothetical protein